MLKNTAERLSVLARAKDSFTLGEAVKACGRVQDSEVCMVLDMMLRRGEIVGPDPVQSRVRQLDHVRYTPTGGGKWISRAAQDMVQ